MRTVFNELEDGAIFLAGGGKYKKLSNYAYGKSGIAQLLEDEKGNVPSMRTETLFSAAHEVIRCIEKEQPK